MKLRKTKNKKKKRIDVSDVLKKDKKKVKRNEEYLNWKLHTKLNDMVIKYLYLYVETGIAVAWAHWKFAF